MNQEHAPENSGLVLRYSTLTHFTDEETKYRCHLFQSAARLLWGGAFRQVIPPLHQFIIQDQQAIFERSSFETDGMLEQIGKEDVIPIQRTAQRIQFRFRAQAFPNLFEAELRIHDGSVRQLLFGVGPNQQNAAVPEPINQEDSGKRDN